MAIHDGLMALPEPMQGMGLSRSELLNFGVFAMNVLRSHDMKMRDLVHSLAFSNVSLHSTKSNDPGSSNFSSDLTTLQNSLPAYINAKELVVSLDDFFATQPIVVSANPFEYFSANRSFSFSCVAIGGLFVFLRLFSKLYLRKASTYRRCLGSEDWVALLAWMMSLSFVLFPNLVTISRPPSDSPNVRLHIGCSHVWDLTRLELRYHLRWLYLGQFLFFIFIWILKVAIMLFYWKLVPRQSGNKFLFFHKSIVAVFILHTGVTFITVITVAFQCYPVSSFWESPATAKCLPRVNLWIAQNVIIIIADVLLLLLPIRVAWKLDVTRREKIIVTGLFGLGGLSILAAIPRAIAGSRIVEDPDIMFQTCSTAMWIQLEVNLALIAICIPASRGLVMRYAPRLLSGWKCCDSKNEPERELISSSESGRLTPLEHKREGGCTE